MICKYCKKDLVNFKEYSLCSDPNCYLFELPRIKTFKVTEKTNVNPKPKGKFEQFKKTAGTMFKDIKDEMGKTLVETKESLNNAGVGYNKDSDVFDTKFGRIDAGGL